MRLLGVELHRFRARRAIGLMLVGVFVLVAWMTIQTIWSTRPVTDAEVAAAKEQAAAEEEFARQDYERCLEDPESYFGGPDVPAGECELYAPDYRWYLTRQPLSLEEELQDTGKAAIIVLAGIAVIVGATFGGADWASGSMSNQLLFRPRRLQVWLAKAIAVALGITVVAAAIIAAQWAAYFGIAEMRGMTREPAFLDDLLTTALRGLALVAGGALGGFAFSMLMRSTVATLALLFFYSVGGEALVAALPFDRVSRWSLGNNVFAWLDDGIQLYDESILCAPTEVECVQQYTLSLQHGLIYLSVLLVLAVTASMLSFRRRDVP